MKESTVIGELVRRITALEARVKQAERRANNLFREGKVTEVDFATGRAVVNAGGVDSPMVPWLTRAGNILDWNPVSVGERVVLISPTGDPAQGMILPGGFSSGFGQNSQTGASPRRSIGSYSFTESAEGAVFKAGGATMTFTADGVVIEVGGVVHELTSAGHNQTGGTQTHDGKNVGSVHTHGGIVRGGSNTNPPN